MRAIVRRASWGVFDQVLSSGSNFALSAFVAASVSVAAFGAFTIVYGVYNLVVGLSGGLASVPLVVRYSAAERSECRAATRAAMGVALAVGALAGMVCILAAFWVSHPVAGPLRALGITLPGLVAQDTWRYSFVADRRPDRAAANDGLWVVLQIAGIVAVAAAGKVTASSMVLVWGASAWVATVAGSLQTGIVPAPQQLTRWLREQRSISWRYAAEAVVHRSGAWLALALVGAVAGLRVVGTLRGALLLLIGPLNLLFMGASFAFVSEGVRLLQRSPGQLRRATHMLAGAMTGVAAVWAVAVLTLPASFGRWILGATWHDAEPLLALLIPYVLLLGASIGPTQGMLALGAARRSLFTQVSALTGQLPLMAAGAAVDGARGAALGTSIAALLRVALASTQFERAVAEHATAAVARPHVAVPETIGA